MKKTAVLLVMLTLGCVGLFAQTASDFDMESVIYRGTFRNWESFAEFARSIVAKTKNFYNNTGENLGVTYITDLSSMEKELVNKGIQQIRARSSSGDGWTFLFTYRRTSSWFYLMYVYWQGNTYQYYLVRCNSSPL